MSEYSHRDLRAQRDADHAFWTVVGLCVGWTVFAFAAPVPIAGVVGVAALLGVGAGYLVWSERMLADYAADLGRARAGRDASGFLRAEAAAGAEISREGSRSGVASPHARRRGSGDEDPSERAPRSETPQAPS